MAPNHDAAMFATYGVFTAIATVALGLRIYSRRLKQVRPAIEDYLVWIAWALAVGECSMLIASTKYAGFGRHADQLGSPEETQRKLVAYAKTFYSASALHFTTLAMSKFSILVQLHRVFVKVWFRRCVYVMAACVLAWWLGSLFAYAFICWPVEANWNPAIPHTCGNSYLALIIDPLPWIVTDFLILILPLPIIKGLELSTAKKWGLAGIFLTGSFTCIVACVRYRTLFAVTEEDPTWTISETGIWNIVEAYISVTCACMIVIRPALKAIFVEGLYRSMSGLASKFRSTDAYGSYGSGARIGDESHGSAFPRGPSTHEAPGAKTFWAESAERGNESGDNVPLNNVRRPQDNHDFV